jgi:predicted RNA-binding Zn ribbon-like protein
VNTQIAEWHRDDVGTPEALTAWLCERGLLREGEAASPEAFLCALDVRSALRELALANTVGPPPGDVRARLGATLAAVGVRAGVGPAGEPVLEPAGDGVERALGLLVAIVLEAEHSGSWRRMKACRKESCRWLFFDASRNRSSSWCSMAICGNRTKTQRYRERQQGSA